IRDLSHTRPQPFDCQLQDRKNKKKGHWHPPVAPTEPIPNRGERWVSLKQVLEFVARKPYRFPAQSLSHWLLFLSIDVLSAPFASAHQGKVKFVKALPKKGKQFTLTKCPDRESHPACIGE